MAFHFAFEKMLHLHAGIERQEEQKLATIAAEIAGIRAEIAACSRRRTEVRRAALQEVASGSSGAELQFAVTCDAAVAELEKKFKVRLQIAEKARARQLEIFRQARQKREMFERLRDRRWAAYQQDAARHEQEDVDENFLMGLSRERDD
jgi:flagellar export protein FliJ